MTLAASPTTDADRRTERCERRVQRYRRRAAVREAGERLADSASSWDAVSWRRQCSCGFAMGDRVGIAWSTKSDSCYAVGLTTCGSVWSCVVCCAKIRACRTSDMEHLAVWHESNGGHLIMLTLTLAHESPDALDPLVHGLTSAFRVLQQSQWWQDLRSLFTVGQVRALEVTHGFADFTSNNGWHPHLHVLLLVSPGCVAGVTRYLDGFDTRRTLAPDKKTGAARFGKVRHVAGLYERWSAAVVSALGEHHRPSAARGCHYTVIATGDARYLTKISQEVTRADLKGGIRQVWSLIDTERWALWAEYCAAMKGMRAVQWSHGLRAMCGLSAVEPTDDEIAQDLALDLDNGVVVAYIERRVWNRLEWQGGIPALLAGYERRCRAARPSELPGIAA